MSDLVARYANGEPVVAILKDAQDRIAKLEAELGVLIVPSLHATGLVLDAMAKGRVRIVPEQEATDE